MFLNKKRNLIKTKWEILKIKYIFFENPSYTVERPTPKTAALRVNLDEDTYQNLKDHLKQKGYTYISEWVREQVRNELQGGYNERQVS